MGFKAGRIVLVLNGFKVLGIVVILLVRVGFVEGLAEFGWGRGEFLE